MKKENLHIFNSKKESAAAAGEFLNYLLLQNIDSPILLLLSGGSSLEILDFVGASALNDKLTITMIDERFSEDPALNNFSNLQKTEFFEFALEKDVNFIGTLPRKGELLKDLTARMEIAITDWIKNNFLGKIFAVLGMGKDGHIAGIFPFPENQRFFVEHFENTNLFTGYDATGKTSISARITGTFTLLKKADNAILFICGKEKKENFKKLITGKNQPNELPAMGIYETKNYKIFTDIAF